MKRRGSDQYLFNTLATYNRMAERVEVDKVLALSTEGHKYVLRGWGRCSILHHPDQFVHVAEQTVIDLSQVEGGVALCPLGFPHAHLVCAHLDHHCLTGTIGQIDAFL